MLQGHVLLMQHACVRRCEVCVMNKGFGLSRSGVQQGPTDLNPKLLSNQNPNSCV